MRYDRIIYSNYTAHRAFDETITGNIIAVVGPNGSGKSNFLRGLRDGMTGEYSKTKERSVSWGQQEGFTEFFLTMGNKKAHLVRKIPSGKVKLEFEGETEPIVKANAVNARILTELGVDKTILENVVFVGQKEIESLLFSPDVTVKDRLSQRFFGIEAANEVEAIVARAVSKISFDNSDQRLPGVRVERERTLERYELLKKELDSYGLLPTPEQIAESEIRIKNSAALAGRIESHRTLKSVGDGLRAELAGLKSQVDAVSLSLKKIDPTQIKNLHQMHLKWDQENQAIAWADANVAKAQEYLDKIVAPKFTCEDLHEAQVKCQPLFEQQSSLSFELQNLTKVLKGMLANETCPTCLQAVDLTNRHALENEFSQKSLALNALIEKVTPLLMRKSVMEGEWTQWERLNTRAKDSLESWKNERAKYGAIHQNVEPAKWAAMLEQYNKLVEKLNSDKQLMARAEVEFKRNQEQCQAYAVGIQDESGNYLEVGETSAASAELENKKKILQSARVCQHNISSTEHALASLNKEIQELEMVEKENRVQVKVQKALMRIRETFHPDGAPKILVSRRMKKLEARIGQYTDLLGCRFKPVARQGMEFDYVFEDGIGDGSDLSVGQQVAMSWAFRWASAETFSSSVGFMTMDEPTATLDKASRGNFVELLINQLQVMAKTHNMQFFISTHDPEIIRACDQVINFK